MSDKFKEAMDEILLLDEERKKRQKRKPQADVLVTEDSAAQEFVDLHENELRYDHTTKRWYRWNGSYWKHDETAVAFHWARQLARKLAKDQDGKGRYITSKVSFAASVEKFARCDPKIAVTRDYWDPDKYLLGTPGGTVDLRTGRLRPASPADLITRQAAVAPAETSDCPHFKAFLQQATNGDDDLIKFIQQFGGYCLTGDTKEQALLFIHGDGGNGKGVLQRVLGCITGSYTAVAATPASSWPARRKRVGCGPRRRSSRLPAATRSKPGSCGRTISSFRLSSSCF